ncbi:MAG: AAA family ATPase [Nitrospinae bacterium]|nr:AAA family ATPase [Nitrospinota bacterium]
MLTKLTARNFKRFDEVEVELGNPVVFIGPNNSGKTSAMQALALWDIGLKRWNEKYSGKRTPQNRPGVTINRRDLLAIPVPRAALLWRELHTRVVRKIAGSQQTNNVRIDLIVEGVSRDKKWTCGLEFDYANPESFYCRPLRRGEGKTPKRMPIPEEAATTHIALLPPMSGLAATETRLDQGAINVRVGEGRTAEVLRNLCYKIQNETPELWEKLVSQISDLFGSELAEPRYVEERGEILMEYREHGTSLDLSSSGRGLQQILLILAYMYANPGAIILLDEPDAHLEILRQSQIYKLITDVAEERGNQIIAASHSEVLLNEAAGKDMVIAFVGPPHRIDDKGSQVQKALREIGFDQYYQAQQTGWVLYLEGSTDLAILRALAERLDHERAMKALERPFVHYVGNQPLQAAQHYHGLREACSDLKGVALFDRLQAGMPESGDLECLMWRKCEIENYFCTRATLEAYARGSADLEEQSLFTLQVDRRLEAMRGAIIDIEGALERLDRGSPWGDDIKASDDFLTPLFKTYFDTLELPNLMAKKQFYELASHVPEEEIDTEIAEKLDAIVRVAESAKPEC